MFEKASRLKLRYETSKGKLSVEDLWDLPLISNSGLHLDSIAKDLYLQLKSGVDVSFVIKEKKSDEIIQLKFDIVKHIIDVKLAEKEQAEQIKLNKERKQQILAVIAQKENEQLLGNSLEDLKKMAESL
ncbi:MAG: hypothetical protein U0354_00155 [Candidatus Sericytochromatia bacterium]